MALMQIRDNRYYRETHGTFEQYCKERWGFERHYANRLIKASEIVDNLVPIGTIPTNEAQVRPLTRIKDPEERREVFQQAVINWYKCYKAFFTNQIWYGLDSTFIVKTIFTLWTIGVTIC